VRFSAFRPTDKNRSSAALFLTAAAFLASGFITGRAVSAVVEGSLRSQSVDAMYGAVSGKSFLVQARKADLSGFFRADPFRLGPSGKAVSATPAESPVTGVLPGIGAFFGQGSDGTFLLIGEALGSDVLRDVTPEGVVLEGPQGLRELPLLYSAAALPALPVPESFSGTEGEKVLGGTVARSRLEELLSDPYKELNKARLRPHMSNGQSDGMEIQFLAKDSLLAQAGAKVGDVVTAVNGVKVLTMSGATNAMLTLLQGRSLDLEVLRGGRKVTLKAEIR
jgi:type II secretory pathway component PulC